MIQRLEQLARLSPGVFEDDLHVLSVGAHALEGLEGLDAISEVSSADSEHS